jgi:hypothetical protein
MVIRGGVVGDPFAFSPMATSAPVKVQGEPQAAQAPLPASPAEAASAPKAPGPLAPATPASPAAPAMKPQ